MDFPRYPEWNPFIRSLTGDAKTGQRIEVVIQLPGRKAETFRPVVVALGAEDTLAWLGALPVPGVFSGEHRFELRDEAGGTHFTQSEAFSGLLVPFLGKILDATELGFRSMNEALASRSRIS